MKYRNFFFAKLAIAFFAITIIVLALNAHISELKYKMNNFLPKNTYINEIYVGGQTLDSTFEVLNTLEQKQLSKQIVILYDDSKYIPQKRKYSYYELGCFSNKAEISKQLIDIMNNKRNILKRVWKYWKIEHSRLDLELPFGFDYKKFMDALVNIDSSALKQPVAAVIKCNNGKVQIIPEQNGYLYDKEKLYNEISNNYSLAKANLTIKALIPSVTAAKLSTFGIKEIISSYTTRFDGSNVPRTANIQLAASNIEGGIIAPGEVFSFNQVVGDRTIEAGYQEAGIYKNGKLDTGIGGGVCQVSTTLYNAALLADLEILERSKHSLTVAYVPLSRDAAVSYGAQDLKFLNNTDCHIYIHSKTTSNTITFEFYSTKSDKNVELISSALDREKAPVQYIDDPTMFFGQEKVIEKGHDGFQSQLVKNIYIDGKLMDSKILSNDKYLTASKIIRRGTRIPDYIKKDDYGL